MKKLINLAALLFAALIAAPLAYAADVNVLILGTNGTYSGGYGAYNDSKSFNTGSIATELQGILGGAGHGTVDVDFEELGSARNSSAGNLITYLHDDYSGDRVNRRLPLLRNQTKAYDYVVLLDSPANIESLPGQYAHGLRIALEEISKGDAQPLLLMSWPGDGSSSSVAHYKEVVYRCGQSLGIPVAPAGLAWQSEGSVHGTAHPTPNGAFIAAASIYSQLYAESASNSTYAPGSSALADRVHAVVEANHNVTYDGRFNWSGNLNKMLFKSARNWDTFSMSSSTENGMRGYLHNLIEQDWNRLQANNGGSPQTRTVMVTRYYSEAGTWPLTFYFKHPGNSSYPESSVRSEVHNESTFYPFQRQYWSGANGRSLPTAIMWLDYLKQFPGSNFMHAGHMGHPNQLIAAYMATMMSGRCPLPPKPDPVTPDWAAWKIGYEMAWRYETLQDRAPGFKSLPSDSTRYTVDPLATETMETFFVLPPQDDVTVTISTNQSWATVSPQTITFTPDNYDQVRTVTVSVAADAPRGQTFEVSYRTSSNDNVCDDVLEKWKYNVNRRPVSVSESATTTLNQELPIPLFATDADLPAQTLTYTITQQPANGTVSVSGNNAIYTPNNNFVGQDSFAYSVSDGYTTSVTDGIVDVTVIAPGAYDLNLLFNPGAEFSTTGWSGSVWEANTNRTPIAGLYVFSPRWSTSRDLYQVVDLSDYADAINAGLQQFSITGYSQTHSSEMRLLVEFRDATGQVLSTYNSGNLYKKNSWRTTSATYLAPVGATSARFILHRPVNGFLYFDELGLVALKPANSAPIAVDPPVALVPSEVASVVQLAATDLDRLPADTLTYAIVDAPTNGTITGWDNGMPVYLPNPGFLGTDSFTFKVNDGTIDSANVATATISVRANEPPTIVVNNPKTDHVYMTLTNGLIVAVTVIDDGAPANPGQLTYSWEQLSGPVNAVFESPNSPDTAINWGDFNAGEYAFRLSASDGEYTVTEDVTVTVGNYSPPTNLAPQILINESFSGTAGSPIAITAIDSSDDLPLDPGYTITEWSLLSGLGTATFADPFALNTTVTFSAGGTFVLRITADDGEVKTYKDVSIEVDGPLPPVVDAGTNQTVTLVASTEPWDPSMMTLATWYDGADASTITSTGGAVSQWRDKSPNNRHLTQTSAAARPTLQGNYLEFDGVDDMLNTGSAFNNPSVTVLGVVRTYTNNAVTDGNKSWLSTTGGSNPDIWLMSPTHADSLGGGNVKVGNDYDMAGVNATRDQDNLVTLASSDAVNAMFMRLDGGAAEVHKSEIGELQQLATDLVVGRQKESASRYHQGRIYEIIIIDRRLAADDPDLLKLEGYLAHKWGLTANLPAGHPYKNFAPTSPNSGVTVPLDGTITSDLPIASQSWTKVGGPGPVEFGGNSQTDTTATFTQLGQYTLRLSAETEYSQGYGDVTITVVAPGLNLPPTADAGSAQTVTDADNSGSEDVTLDGAASSDSDGTIASYSWDDGTGTVKTGVAPTFTLAVGVHTITLTVTDDDGATDTDTVVITINAPANTAPTADAGSAQTVTDADNSGSEDVTLDGAASVDSDGTIASYSWDDGSGTVKTGVAPTFTLAVGVHTITLTVTDDDGATDTDTVVITINAPANTAPTADAGSAQTVTDADNSGSEDVTLDGAASVDSDGTIASFSWDNGSGTVKTGVAPTFTLAVGVHTITLTVTDDDGATDTDTVVITINAPANTAPTADAGENQTVGITTNGVPWDPSMLSLATWYDSADAATITSTGGAVSQWRDKSPNNRHLSQSTAAARPTLKNNYLEFDGVNDVLNTGTGFNSPSVTVLGVVRTYTNNDVTDGNKSWLSTTGGTNPDVWLTSPTHVDRLGGMDQKTGNDYDGVGVNATRDQDHLVTLASSDAVNAMFIRLDGGSAEVHKSEIGELQQLSTDLVVGRQKESASRYHQGRIYEIIIIDHRLAADDTDLLKLEGYLAHKWGLTANLPAGHPYKGAAPTVTASSANVTLDGSGSIDSDGTIASYSWDDGNGTVKTGVAPTFTLPVGAHTITLTVTDDDGATDADDVVITVNDVVPPNTAPVANDDAVTTDEDTAVAITLNANDTDGDSLTYSFTQPANGTLSGTAPNLTYTPDAGFSGSDSFGFVANDGVVDSNVATVTITVTPVGVPQTVRYEAEDAARSGASFASNNAGYSGTGFVDYRNATGDFVEWTVAAGAAGDAEITFGYALGASDRPLQIQVNGVVVNDSLSFPSTGGWTTWRETAILSVPLNAGDNTIRATAIGSSGGNVDYLDVTVNQVVPQNSAPVANDDALSTSEDLAVAVTLNATDADGDALTYAVLSPPANGTLSGTAPNLIYTPNAGFTGTDGFSFITNDGVANSNVGTVSMTVNEALEPAFIQAANGLVSIEAENHQDRVGTATKDWVELADGSASGGLAMDSAPDDGVSAGGVVRMDYRVDFATAGTHYLWVRGRAWPRTGSRGNADSFFYGINGAVGVAVSSFGTNYGWSRNHFGTSGVAAITVPSAGVHTVNIFLREDGFVCDKLVVTSDPSYVPSGFGPAESPQQTAPSAASEPAVAAAPVATTSEASITAPEIELYQLTVEADGKQSHLQFGLVADGDAVDGAYADASSLGGTAYLVDEVGAGRLVDVRTLDEVVRWQLVVEAIGEPMTVSWDGFIAPDGMALYLQETDRGRPVGAAIDMTKTDQVTCIEPTEYEVVMGLVAKHVLQLNAGWNLVSQPLLSLNPPTFDDAYAFKGRRWSKLTDAAVITAGSGYLVHAAEIAELTVLGLPAAAGMHLDRGWKLVGTVDASRLPEDAGKAYRLDAHGNEVDVTIEDVLAPGDAVMIQVRESGWFKFETAE